MPKTKYMSEIEYLNKPKFKNESYYVQIIMEKLVGAAMTFPGLDSSRIEKLNIRWWCCCGVDETSNYWFKRRQPFLKSSSFKDDANFQVKTPIRDFSNDLCAKDEKEAEGETLNEKSSTSFEFDIWARKWTWLHQQQQEEDENIWKSFDDTFGNLFCWCCRWELSVIFDLCSVSQFRV